MKKIISVSAYFVSLAVFALGLFFFVFLNHGIFFSTAAMAVIFAVLVLSVPAVYFFIRKKESDDSKAMKILPIVMIVGASIMLIMTILYSVIIDYFQPISITTLSMVLLIVGAVFLLISSLVGYLLTDDKIMSIAVPVMVILTMTVGYVWGNTQGFMEFSNIEGDATAEEMILFDEFDEYATFRIPSLYAIPHDVLNEEYGSDIDQDMLIAMAEGRRDSSHDRGRIDMVMKTSTNGGADWSDLKVLYEFGDTDADSGKYGNPTIVFNEVNGELNVAHMSATTVSDYNYDAHNAIYTFDKDLNLVHVETIDMSMPKTDEESTSADGVRKDTLMIGPGKGTQMKYNGVNRLILPCSNNGNSFVMYSDDNGRNWEKGDDAGTGNECEATVLASGELVMVIRESIGGAAFHPKQYQRLSYSKTGGETWYEETKEIEALRTPICMSSIDTMADGRLVMSYPDAFNTRANLTFAESKDNGTTWTTKLLYAGAAGYSCMAVDSYDNIYVLAEVGAVNYNEVLSFMKVTPTKV